MSTTKWEMRSQSKELRSVKGKSFVMETVRTVLGDRGKPQKWHSSPFPPSQVTWYPGFINLFNSWYYFVIQSKERENLGLSVGVCLISWFESESRSVMSDSLWPHGLHSPWNSLDKNTGVGSLSLLQWIFLIQESNWGLLHCRWILYQLSYQGWFSVIAVYPSYLFSLLSSGDIKKVWTCMKLLLVGFQELAGSRESPS